MLNDSNAGELVRLAKETGALTFRGQLRYPGPDTGDWEIGDEVIPDVQYPLRDREVLLIVAPVEGGASLHLCGMCGFVLHVPGEPCLRCAVTDDDVAAAIEDPVSR